MRDGAFVFCEGFYTAKLPCLGFYQEPYKQTLFGNTNEERDTISSITLSEYDG